MIEISCGLDLLRKIKGFLFEKRKLARNCHSIYDQIHSHVAEEYELNHTIEMTMTITNIITAYFIPTHLKKQVKEFHKTKLLVIIHLLLFIITFTGWVAQITSLVDSDLPSSYILLVLIYLS